MYELVIQVDFAAAHNLRGYCGECENLHGHNWKLDIYLRSEKLDDLGMVMDFKVAKEHISAILDTIDHKYLNEVDYFREVNPTTENIARFMSEQLAKKLPDGVGVDRITVWESDRCGATYWPGA